MGLGQVGKFGNPNSISIWNRPNKRRRYDHKMALKPFGSVLREDPETVNIRRTAEDDDTEGGRAEFVTKIAERFKENGRI